MNGEKEEKKVERTEEDKLFGEPVKVTLAGREYEIKLLPIGKAREWRKKYAKLFSDLPSYFKVDSSDPAAFATALEGIYSAKQDQIIDLFFAYAEDLNRDEIEQTANEAELAVAAKAVFAVGNPILKTLVGIRKGDL